jgi:phospholipase C
MGPARLSPLGVLAVLVVLIGIPTQVQAACTATGSAPSVTICTPTAGATATSPVTIEAAAVSSSAVNLMQVWVDGAKKYEVAAASISTQVAMATGARRLTVQARDASGAWFKQTINITVSTSSGGGGGSTDCVLNPASPSVTICTPADGAIVANPVRITAGSTSSSPVQYIQVYVDGVKKYQTAGGSLDVSLTLATGQRRIAVQAVNQEGQAFKDVHYVTVTAPAGGTSSPIAHLVVVIMQNRSFNHLFGVMPGVDGILPGTNGYSQTDASGNTVTPYLITTAKTADLPHDRGDYLATWNQGAMDKFAAHNGRLSMGYYDNSMPGIDRLWGWANDYALADNYYSSVMSNAPANQLYLVAASDANFAWSFYPYYGPCKTSTRAPYTFQNVGDQLNAAGVSWGWFQAKWGECGTGYVPQQNPFQYFTSTHDTANIQELNAFYTKLDAGALPAVSWVTAHGTYNMHPGGSVTTGANWLDGFIKRVQNSSAWPETAIVVIWDEGGGWWDHRSPQQVDSQGLGIRVPMLVISPYAKRGYVSHIQMDHVSILRFIQWNWKLSSLNARNGASNNLLDMFTF